MTKTLFPKLPGKIIRLLESWFQYGNPWQVLGQRMKGKSVTEFRVVDRQSGVVCLCKPDAHRMFGEVWFDHDYDVPGTPLRTGDVVLDIGGNQGFFTCYAAWLGCRVLSYEPDEENINLMEKNLHANDLHSLVTVMPAAVQAQEGEVELFRTKQLGGGMNTTVTRIANDPSFNKRDSVTVPAVSIRSILRDENLEQIRLCKMDCEGAELEIIESMSEEDMRRIESFAIEFHRGAYPPARLVAELERWGTHHVFPAAAKSYCQRDILYAISKETLRKIS